MLNRSRASEAQFRIAANNPSWAVDLSEQFLFSCGGGQCGYGWYVSAVLNRIPDYGTPDEACYPYQPRDFFGHRSGVYHCDRVSQPVGGHAIVIVGYDSNERYWIVKNS